MLRRMLGPIMLGHGIFLLVLAYLLPFVVYPKLAILPTDPQVGQIAHGTGFNVFLPRSVKEGGVRIYRNVDVTSKVFVSEDNTGGVTPQSSPNAHWRVATRTYVQGDKLLETTVEGVSLNRHTSLANNCCGDYLLTEKGDTVGKPLVHEGYVFMFPFGTKKQTYPVWDASVREPVDAVYAGAEKVRGYSTYRFEQYVPNTKTGTQDLPGSLFGLKDPTVTADYMYKTHRTYWIEPNSGAIVNYREAMDRRFDYQGKEIPVIQGTLSLVPPAAADPINGLLSQASKGLPLLRWRLTILFVPLGVGLIIAGIVRIRRQQRLDDEYDEWDDWEDDENYDDYDDYDDEEPQPEPVRLDSRATTSR